jgi:DNA-binding YbaB/EbfC family protein
MFNPEQLADLMKQAQAMQDNLAKAQEELAHTVVVGQSASGGVQISMTCKHEVRHVEIAAALLTEDKEMLQDLIAAAFNAALLRAEQVGAEKLGKMTAGMLGMPDGLKLPL